MPALGAPKARAFRSQAPCLAADCSPDGGQLATARDHPGQRHLMHTRHVISSSSDADCRCSARRGDLRRRARSRPA